MIKWLEGKKTYLLVALGLGIYTAQQLGWITIDKATAQELMNAVTLAAIAALRAGVVK